MARVKVQFTATITQIINWPDDEIEHLNYDNVMANFDSTSAHSVEVDEISDITVDGKEFYF